MTKSIHHWQTAKILGDSLGRSWQQIAKRSAHPYIIERKPPKPGGQPLYRVKPEERESQIPDGHFWLEWDGYIDVYDGAIDEVVETYFFHDVEPGQARRLATGYCGAANGEVAS